MKTMPTLRLSDCVNTKRKFNPADVQDLKEYRHYRANDSWRVPCPFLCEWPYSTVIDTIDNKIIDHQMKSIPTIRVRK